MTLFCSTWPQKSQTQNSYLTRDHLRLFRSTPVCEDNFNLLQFIFNQSKNSRPFKNHSCDVIGWQKCRRLTFPEAFISIPNQVIHVQVLLISSLHVLFIANEVPCWNCQQFLSSLPTLHVHTTVYKSTRLVVFFCLWVFDKLFFALYTNCI